MLKTKLSLLTATVHGRNLHGACLLTMDGSTEDVLSSVLSSALSSPRSYSQVSDIAHRLSLSF